MKPNLIYVVSFFDGSIAGPVVDSAWTDLKKAEAREDALKTALEEEDATPFGGDIDNIGSIGVAAFDLSNINKVPTQ